MALRLCRTLVSAGGNRADSYLTGPVTMDKARAENTHETLHAADVPLISHETRAGHGKFAIDATFYPHPFFEQTKQGLYNTPTKKVLGLLQWMEGSSGKKRMSSRRGTAIVPAFNILPLQVNRARRE